MGSLKDQLRNLFTHELETKLNNLDLTEDQKEDLKETLEKLYNLNDYIEDYKEFIKIDNGGF